MAEEVAYKSYDNLKGVPLPSGTIYAAPYQKSLTEWLYFYGLQTTKRDVSTASEYKTTYAIPEDSIFFLTNAYLYQYNVDAKAGAGVFPVSITTKDLKPVLQIIINGLIDTNHTANIAFNPPLLLSDNSLILDNQQTNSFVISQIWGFLVKKLDFQRFLSSAI